MALRACAAANPLEMRKKIGSCQFYATEKLQNQNRTIIEGARCKRPPATLSQNLPFIKPVGVAEKVLVKEGMD